jgi:XTP/dITP diphosphohydrolase
MKLVFATNNKNKLKEISMQLNDEFILQSLEDIGCEEEVPETANTIEGNASQKANYIFLKYGTPCFADDTGLEIEALNNAPGVYSARYAGPERNDTNNINKVLLELDGQIHRKARFKTIISLVIEEKEQLFEGIINGTIVSEKRGNNGFGYDPIFVPDGYSETFAEMDPELKNKISHRAIAFRKLIEHLNKTKLV